MRLIGAVRVPVVLALFCVLGLPALTGCSAPKSAAVADPAAVAKATVSSLDVMVCTTSTSAIAGAGLKK